MLLEILVAILKSPAAHSIWPPRHQHLPFALVHEIPIIFSLELLVAEVLDGLLIFEFCVMGAMIMLKLWLQQLFLLHHYLSNAHFFLVELYLTFGLHGRLI